jgi:hypothetical protein
MCEVPGCGGRHYARGWCVTHYRRWQRHGDPQPETPVQPRVTDTTSYGATLQRLRAERGPAATQLCTGCGAAATCWSYNGGDPDERTDPRTGAHYSLDPERYRPRCHYCHRRTSAERREGLTTGTRRRPDLEVPRAIRLYQAGASCRGIGAVMGVSGSTIRAALRAHGVALRESGRPRR